MAKKLNFIHYTKVSDSINVGFNLESKDTTTFILKSECRAYQLAVQIFRMDTLSNVVVQLSNEITLGEPERILAYGLKGSLTIVNLKDLPLQAKVIFEGFKQEVLTSVTP